MLSVCIIAKNEEKNIGRCLNALSGYGFELVVVDTGSTDSTREIAKGFTDTLYEFEWQDDFSAAKNYAISKASNNIVLLVDSDEFLEPLSNEDLRRLEELIYHNSGGIGRVRMRNLFQKDGIQQENREWINRIFDRRKYGYEGRIHEQVMPRVENVMEGEKIYQTWQAPMTFLHTGYDLTPEEKRQKTQRNITLLEIELNAVTSELESLRQVENQANTVLGNGGLAEDEGEISAFIRKKHFEEQIPYLLYQLGKSYYMAGDYPQACGYFSQGLSYDLNPRLEYVVDMVETYGYALINSGREEEALSFENIYEQFGDTADFQFLMGLVYMKNACFEAAVEEFEKALHQPDCRNAGVNSYAANYNIGVIYECLGKRALAVEYYRKCKTYAPAQERLKDMEGYGEQ